MTGPSGTLSSALSLAFAETLRGEALPLVLRNWTALVEAASAARLAPALAFAFRSSGVLAGLPRPAPRDGRVGPAAWVETAWEAHSERRAAQLRSLEAVVGFLNAGRWTPILLKGARSLWLGEPDWRSMRDLDLLMGSPAEADAAHARLIAAGYAEAPGGEHEPGYHHASSLTHPDLPGWIEVHRRAGPRRVELFLSSDELRSVAVRVQKGALSALVLPPAHDCLHGLLHHHFGHREVRNGVLELKGLFEFAMSLEALSSADRAFLAARAGEDNRVLAALDLWVAAASERFGLAPTEPLAIEDDARARWAGMLAMRGRPGKVSALRDEVGFCLAPERLRRCRHGNRAATRAAIRLRTLAWAATAFGQRNY